MAVSLIRVSDYFLEKGCKVSSFLDPEKTYLSCFSQGTQSFFMWHLCLIKVVIPVLENDTRKGTAHGFFPLMVIAIWLQSPVRMMSANLLKK